MNRLHAVGRLYWVVRDFANTNTPLISMGIVRETDYPWRHGKGIQLRTRKHTVQVGLCKRVHMQDETDGVLQAIGGREMDTPAQEIGMW